MTGRFDGKVAIVTGAAQGIGLACAQRFAAEGATVLLSDIDVARGAAAAESIPGAGFFAADVGDKRSVDALIAEAVARFGGLDIVVANAGVAHVADFLTVTEEDFDRVIRINLKGVFLTGQAAARRTVEQGRGGAIITMSSANAVLAIPTQVPYTVSKGGVNQLTKVMAIALAPHGIRVNAIGPGTIATELARNAVMTDPAAKARILSRTPLGRLGEPSEIASVAAFLASEDASYITGQTIYPDGGRLGLNYVVPVAG